MNRRRRHRHRRGLTRNRQHRRLRLLLPNRRHRLKMIRPPSERVIACGQSESGKTEFLLRHFLTASRTKCAERQLVVDRTGEWFEREKYAPTATGLADTVRLLDDYATRKRWRIIVSLSNEEVEQLGAVLVGIPDVRKGYSYNVGGMALVVSEVDLLVPFANAPEELRSLWRRGSHAGLSIYADTQRPSNVSKEATSQCRWMCYLALYEPADLEYIRKQAGMMAPEMVAWIQGTQYAAALFDQRRRACHLIAPNGVVKRTLSHNPQDASVGETPSL